MQRGRGSRETLGQRGPVGTQSNLESCGYLVLNQAKLDEGFAVGCGVSRRAAPTAPATLVVNFGG
ncbi:hypothetical protein Poly21_44160 [Allorhodopirellula heiligendammensis]|uniref:Uncharacterized protein n=1 Tax=Allorhodopirellula heiligendammensis TaxID=2714739 RepID=A0A5C6BG96_9BACT|nr:hypothetical protein Poly21_44160 [Allorhodopirellula heiligendammensis]